MNGGMQRVERLGCWPRMKSIGRRSCATELVRDEKLAPQASTSHPLLQLRQQWQLVGNYFALRHWKGKIGDAIDFRKVLSPPRSRRPFQFKCVAGKTAEIEVAFERESVQELAAFLPDRRKLGQHTLGDETGFFPELSACRSDNII